MPPWRCAEPLDAPILARGAGTSLAGQSCNVAVVLDFTKYMNRILELDVEKRIARVQPGVMLDTLREQSRAASASHSGPTRLRTAAAASAA